jgi:hypothetical protein
MIKTLLLLRSQNTVFRIQWKKNMKKGHYNHDAMILLPVFFTFSDYSYFWLLPELGNGYLLSSSKTFRSFPVLKQFQFRPEITKDTYPTNCSTGHHPLIMQS